MIPNRFEAVLKTEDDRILETGVACISAEDQSIEFKNEFVPLLKLGSTAKIVRIEDEREIHCFTGQVYLSSRRLLRIISISDELFPEAFNYLWLNTSIHAKIFPATSNVAPVYGEESSGFDAEVYYVSLKNIKFTSKKQFHVGQKLYLYAHEPIGLDMVELEIFQIISFGKNVVGYRCKIASLSEPCCSSLKSYLEKYNRPFA